MERLGVAAAPLRAEPLLESAVMRPQMVAHYEDADLFRQATLLAVGISQAQAFLDGNKRTTYAACVVFLRMNGWVFQGDPIQMAKRLESIAEESGERAAIIADFEKWLRKHTAPA